MDSNRIIEALRPEELAVYRLRALYADFGYSLYKMSKFEEYDLYMKNKDFLVSKNIITFTDEGGKLLALKPDVTLSIIKNHTPNSENTVKLCYNENVYRTSGSTHSFREIMQVGLECIGKIDDAAICEVVLLASRSLAEFSKEYALELSSLDITDGLISELKIAGEVKKRLLGYIGSKNTAGIRTLLLDEGVEARLAELLIKMVGLYGSPSKVIPELSAFCISDRLNRAVEHFTKILTLLDGMGISDKLFVDFSTLENTKYYNGIAMKGYIEGIPTAVLSGGQYDNLLSRMKKNEGGIGFAVYLDELERLPL